MTDLVRVPKSDQELIDRVVKARKKPIEEILPESLTPDEVVRFSKSAASLLKRNDGERAICFSVLGRLHWLSRKNPDVLKRAKCSNIREYEDRILGCAEHRSTLWKFSSAYGLDPKATPERLEAIGSEKLAIASQVFKNASPDQKADALAKAEEITGVDNYRKWAEEESGLSGKGETQGASFQLFGSRAEVDELKVWLADIAFRRWAQAKNDQPIGMILASIHASTSDWDSNLPVGEILQAVRQFLEDGKSVVMTTKILDAIDRCRPVPESVQPGPAGENHPSVEW